MFLNASQADVRASDNAIAAQSIVQDAAWWDLVGQFRQAAAKLEALYASLLQQRDYALARPSLAGPYQALMARVAPLRAQIAGITNGANRLIGWFRNLGLQGLGILPLIPIAVVAAALALITKWSLDARALSQRITEQQRLEATGVSPERAASIVAQTAIGAGGFFASLAGSAKTVGLVAVLGGLGYLAWKNRNR